MLLHAVCVCAWQHMPLIGLGAHPLPCAPVCLHFNARSCMAAHYGSGSNAAVSTRLVSTAVVCGTGSGAWREVCGARMLTQGRPLGRASRQHSTCLGQLAPGRRSAGNCRHAERDAVGCAWAGVQHPP